MPSFKKPTDQAGFTLMEIVVATTIFAVVSVALLSLFDYTLKINRRSEALRQATQGMRNFVELLIKEIRNGQIDYAVVNGEEIATPIGPCPIPKNSVVGGAANGRESYEVRDNRLGIITLEGERICFYLGYGKSGAQPTGSYVGANVFHKNTTVGSSGYNPEPTLVVNKNNTLTEVLNPPNFSVESLMFYVRPVKDPYMDVPPGALAKTQPAVTIMVGFRVKLPTGEEVPLYYQSSVSSDKYDIPN